MNSNVIIEALGYIDRPSLSSRLEDVPCRSTSAGCFSFLAFFFFLNFSFLCTDNTGSLPTSTEKPFLPNKFSFQFTREEYWVTKILSPCRELE